MNATLSLFEIYTHASYSKDGVSTMDTFVCEVWVETQSQADAIAKAFKASTGAFDCRAYYSLSGVVRPE